MTSKSPHLSSVKKDPKKRSSLVKAIAKKSLWSYPNVSPSRVPDGKLIEKVLIHGNDQERKQLFDLFPIRKVQNIWERKLIIQEPRLHDLNRKIAASYFHIQDPEEHIQKSYKKHNLYDRYSVKNA